MSAHFHRCLSILSESILTDHLRTHLSESLQPKCPVQSRCQSLFPGAINTVSCKSLFCTWVHFARFVKVFFAHCHSLHVLSESFWCCTTTSSTSHTTYFFDFDSPTIVRVQPMSECHYCESPTNATNQISKFGNVFKFGKKKSKMDFLLTLFPNLENFPN